jgi:hypothetical protein
MNTFAWLSALQDLLSQERRLNAGNQFYGKSCVLLTADMSVVTSQRVLETLSMFDSVELLFWGE